jgi:segregation and condensation protein B
MLTSAIQALIFVSPTPISTEEILEALHLQNSYESLNIEILTETLAEIQKQFSEVTFGFELEKSALGWKFVTKKEHYPVIASHIESYQKKRLSKSALETLSIIAFQPDCTKTDIELIRGVAADYAIDKLLERELIEISGRKETIGHPAMYRTSPKFLDYFGLNSIEELPKPEKIQQENALGQEEEDTNEVN